MLSDGRDAIDLLLDSALSSYVAAKPSAGLEKRVIKCCRPAAPKKPLFTLPNWIWSAAAASAVCAIIVAAAWIPSISTSIFGVDSPSLILPRWLESIEATQFSTSIRESSFFFPFLDVMHVIGLVLMLGPLMMLDLRLIGVLWKSSRVSKIATKFIPLALAGFVIVAVTGGLLFWAKPLAYYGRFYFRLKVVLMVLAFLNALIFHATIERKIAIWDNTLPPPPRARLAGVLGLVLWTAVVFAGRFMAVEP
jgi:hypothetical protein